MSDNLLNDAPVANAESPNSEQSQSTDQNNTIASFIDSLPAELKGEASLQKFKDVPSLAKSYIHQEKLIGSSIRIPAEDAAPEAKKAFLDRITTVPGVVHIDPNNPESMKAAFKHLGAPESVTEYELGIESSAGIPDDLVLAFKEKALNVGLNKTQAKEIANLLASNAAKSIDQSKQAIQEGLNLLKQDWGNEFDSKLSQAKEAFGWYEAKFPSEAKLLKASAGNNPMVVRMLADMHGALSERGHIKGQGMELLQGAAGARQKLDAIKADHSHPVWNQRHAGHTQALQEYDSLFKQAYSSSSTSGQA